MAIQSCAPAAQGELAKGQEKVAWAMYVGEHTSQAASVGSVRQGRTDPARSGLLSPLVGKGFAFFDKLKKSFGEKAVRRAEQKPPW